MFLGTCLLHLVEILDLGEELSSFHIVGLKKVSLAKVLIRFAIILNKTIYSLQLFPLRFDILKVFYDLDFK